MSIGSILMCGVYYTLLRKAAGILGKRLTEEASRVHLHQIWRKLRAHPEAAPQISLRIQDRPILTLLDYSEILDIIDQVRKEKIAKIKADVIVNQHPSIHLIQLSNHSEFSIRTLIHGCKLLIDASPEVQTARQTQTTPLTYY
jgi:hypothetical protein